MTSIQIVALVSGLAGALVSAYLSYIVRLKAKAREDADERRRLAHVNFLMLTDSVAGNLYLKLFIDRIVQLYNVKLEGFDVSHAAAAFFAKKIAEAKAEDRVQIQRIIKPLIAMMTNAAGDFEVSQSDLGRMNDVTIYSYYRYKSSLSQLKTSLLLFDQYVEQGVWSVTDASVLHGIFRCYAIHAEAAGILRAAFKTNAGVSDNYAFKCLTRSYNAAQKAFVASFEQGSKLELAKKAAQETGDVPQIVDGEGSLQIATASV